jgi:hypothetical protein
MSLLAVLILVQSLQIFVGHLLGHHHVWFSVHSTVLVGFWFMSDSILSLVHISLMKDHIFSHGWLSVGCYWFWSRNECEEDVICARESVTQVCITSIVTVPNIIVPSQFPISHLPPLPNMPVYPGSPSYFTHTSAYFCIYYLFNMCSISVSSAIHYTYLLSIC